MSAAVRWPLTFALVVIWLPFGLAGLLGDGGRFVADRIVDLIDRINE